uniref:hypothetical protein n=1 Tax=Prevotella sp. TaxID=59823 RepID=UPI003FEEB9B9
MKSRMALVGHNCMVSSLADGVTVGSGSKNLSYLCDDDLDNYYTLPSVANVNFIVGSPIVAVKDMKHYIDKDTKAGFKISGESSLLKLDVLKTNYQIRFYKDGKILLTSDIEQLGFSVLELTLGSVSLDNNLVDIVAAKQPTEDYDEIALIGKSGVNIDAVNGLKIYYAFVGDAEYSLTKTKIKQYDENITLNAKSSTHSVPTLIHDLNYFNRDLIDEDLSNGIVISALLQLGSSGYAQVIANNGKSTETFPAGTEAGFVYSDGALIGAGVTPVIYLLGKNGNEIYKKAIETTVLSVSIGGKQKKISIKAPVDFSGIKFRTMGVEVANGVTANYAFIIPKPESAGHQCEMSPAASLDLCNCNSHYQLKWDKENFPNATWSIKRTSDKKVKFDPTNNTLDFSETDSYKNNTGEKVTVEMILKSDKDNCTQTITINWGGSTEQKPENKKETVLYNTDPAHPVYEMGDGSSFGINLASIVKNSANIISSNLSSYATYFGGVSIGDSYLCSVKKKVGKISDGTAARQSGERQVGFVVTAKGTGLSADVLKLMNVRIYNEGKQVADGVTTAAVAAKLIGSQNSHKVRYSINVPASTVFDEIRLYSTGLLGADLSVMNIYYAYTADADAVLDDPLVGAEMISFDKTNASIDADRTQSIVGVNGGNGLKDITNCIDGSLETKTTFPTGLKVASGSVLAVKLGVTATRNKQLVVVINKDAVGVGVSLADAIVVKTYKTGQDEPVETFNDWSVLGANVITLGDKGYIFINPTADYDEVAITEGAGLDLFTGLSVYGLLLRNDKDGDGTPDVDEPADDCKQDLVFQENEKLSEKKQKKYKENLTMYFQRSFVIGDDEDKDKWNSLIMPVSLTKAQFTQAFGETAQLAQAYKVYEANNGNLVIGFSLVEETDAHPYLVANKPYIIKVAREFIKKHIIKENNPLQTIDAGPLTGQVYTVDNSLAAGGISYTYDDATGDGPVSIDFPPVDKTITNKWGMNGLTFKGSYDNHQNLGEDNYIWNNGKLYHLTKTNHWMKGYRCWLVPSWVNSTDAKLLTFGFGDDETTGIDVPFADISTNNTKVYNLNGQRVDNMLGVQPGIYIVNGKKVVVK